MSASGRRETALGAAELDFGIDTSRIGRDLHAKALTSPDSGIAQLQVPIARLTGKDVSEAGELGDSVFLRSAVKLDGRNLNVGRALVVDLQLQRFRRTHVQVPPQGSLGLALAWLHEDRQTAAQRNDESLQARTRRRWRFLPK